MLELPVFLLLLLLIISDFRMRQVRLSHLLGFGAVQLAVAFYRTDYRFVLCDIGINCMLLILWGMVCVLYYRIYRRSPLSAWKNKIGMGDLIFLFFLTPVFPAGEILIFLCAGLLFSLGYCGIDRLVCGRFRSIPLVSTLGCCYLFVLIKNLIF